MKVIENPTANIATVFKSQRKFAQKLRVEPVGARKDRLRMLRTWIHENRLRICDAAFKDFRKAQQEVDTIEIFHVLNEIKLALNNVDQWAAPRKIDAPITMLGTRSYLQAEPRGVCLIISPWNYPFSLAVGPLVSALAAGNAAIVKPSELTPTMSALLKEMADTLFRPEEVFVAEGDAAVAGELLKLPFDHMFFTGSTAVGKIVMKAAAEHLSSVTLELGGKSPVFVTRDADLSDAAERITVAKFVNNGQTCIAPDYVLVDAQIKDKLIQKIKQITAAKFLGKGKPEESESYCRIVNTKHFDRISNLIEDAVARGAKVEWDGTRRRDERFMHPVILSEVPAVSGIMEEEIFGPVLPVIAYSNVEDAIAMVNAKAKPLALYVFGSGADSKRIVNNTSAGGVCINDCGIHFLHHNLPFGGINASGLGQSHGHYGFLSFSHEKPVLRQKSGITTLRPFYPPYTKASQKLVDWFLKLF